MVLNYNVRITLNALSSYLHIAMGSGDDVNALSTLFILKNARVIFCCQNKEQILAFPLRREKKVLARKEKKTLNILPHTINKTVFHL